MTNLAKIEEIARLILSVSAVSYDEATNERRAMARAAAEKVLAALPPSPALVPSGWVMVPVVATAAMLDAHYGAHARADTAFAGAQEVWAAMLAASPSPPALDGAGREGWQPIETAPKDGTCIYLAWNSEDWTLGEGMWRGDGWVASGAFYNPDLPHPRMEFREYRPANPLWWQPLPASPKESR